MLRKSHALLTALGIAIDPSALVAQLSIAERLVKTFDCLNLSQETVMACATAAAAA